MTTTSLGRARRALLVLALVVVATGLPVGPGGAATTTGERTRVVIQLEDPPVASYRDTLPALTGVLSARTSDGHLDVGNPAARAYRTYLRDKQAAFETLLRQAVPEAEVHWRYRIGFNGLAVEMDRAHMDTVAALSGVRAVTETYELEFELDESAELLQIGQLWSQLPAPHDLPPGNGLRVALIDSGVNANHPFFEPAGYSAPEGYPRSERVAGGTRTPLSTEAFASEKVIVASVYAPPGDTTSTPFGPGSAHGTHVAGIMAGVRGTYTYASGPATFDLEFSGMAPGAHIMSYSLAGDSAEFLAAIEDVIADRADALNISLGHSRWVTTDMQHDHIKQALEAAVDAGTIVAASAGNAGANGDSNVTGSWKMSPRVITVASSSHGRVFSNAVSVTGPGDPPDDLVGRVGIPAAPPAPPIGSTISGIYTVAPGGADGNAGNACSALPAGTVTGRIVVVARGECTFDAKKNNVVAGGAIAMIVHNNAADAPIVMGGFQGPTIPGVMVSRGDGRSLVGWAADNPQPTVAIEGPTDRLRSGWPDVVSSFSSRGPSPATTIKPDIAAPGASILSSIVDASGNATPPHFEQFSGTSMATPHVTAIAALTKALHPSWTPAQVKSALMNTAETDMYLDIATSVPALAKHRGAGRVAPARLADATLTFDAPSLPLGLVHSGDSRKVAIRVTDMRAGGPSLSYSVDVRPLVGDPAVALSATPSLLSAAGQTARIEVDLITAGAPRGDYEGFIEITGAGETYTIPYFVRVLQPADRRDVLLIDWDRNVPDRRAVYTGALDALGLTYDVFDGGTSTAANGNPGPTFAQLQNYGTVILYTGDNFTSWSTAHTGGSFPLQDYVTGGGRLLLIGEDLVSAPAFNQNTGTDYNLTQMGGWMDGLERVNVADTACATARSDGDFYGEVTAGTLHTAFTLLGRTGDVSVGRGGDGAGNQNFPDAGRAIAPDDDENLCIAVYNADNIARHARVLGTYTTTRNNGVDVDRMTDGVATGVAPDATLENPEPDVNWAAAVMHVGIEGLNANLAQLSPAQALGLLYDFVNDSVTVTVNPRVRGGAVDLRALASSSRGAQIVRYRWDFGDGSPIVETATSSVSHVYAAPGDYKVRVEAVDALTRSGIGKRTVRIAG